MYMNPLKLTYFQSNFCFKNRVATVNWTRKTLAFMIYFNVTFKVLFKEIFFPFGIPLNRFLSKDFFL